MKMNYALYTGVRWLLFAVMFQLLLMPCACNSKNGSQTEQGSAEKAASNDKASSNKRFKILHIMSYHTPWAWTDDQFNGFKNALNDVDVEYKVVQMDLKRNNSQEWKEQAADEAIALINEWNPDLVYTSDDGAQDLVTRQFINSPIPFVFSGVNANPQSYGFVGSSNITGVVEIEHFVETVELLRELVPNVRKVAVIWDDGQTWDGIIKRMRVNVDNFPNIEFVSWDKIKTFEEYKAKVKECQTTVDAIALLGIFTFKDENNKNVPYEQVLRWTEENSKLPDFSFWRDRITRGTLCAVTVSGYEQGLAAGNIARKILLDGISPSSIPMTPTKKGEAVISLARAEKLGIAIKSAQLLSTDVITQFEWEK